MEYKHIKIERDQMAKISYGLVSISNAIAALALAVLGHGCLSAIAG